MTSRQPVGMPRTSLLFPLLCGGQALQLHSQLTPALIARMRRDVAMGISSERMASRGLLYTGWGAEGIYVLNQTSLLLEEAYDRGMNRYELTLALARRAKENAYPVAEVHRLHLR